MSVSVTYALTCVVNQTFETGIDGSDNPNITFSSFDVSGFLNASSTPPATKKSIELIALTAGAYTIDLTSLVDANGATIDGTGLKVQILRIKNNGAAAMTFSEGASDGYALFGSSWAHVIGPGNSAQWIFNDNAPDVASGDKDIDVAGTGTQEFELTIVLG